MPCWLSTDIVGLLKTHGKVADTVDVLVLTNIVGAAAAQLNVSSGMAVIDVMIPAVSGTGNGPIDAFVHATREAGLRRFELLNYSEHSLGSGAEARAVSYIQIKTEEGRTYFGAGTDTNIERASIKAIVSAINRASS